ncbi:hypothetical protein BDW71DRAFT_197419 [Aspergillus fruticulosus]
MASYLITGASRGLGLGLIHSLATKPPSKTDTLKELSCNTAGWVVIIPLHVDSKESIKHTVKYVGGNKGLDMLINVAAIITHFPEGITAMDDLNYIFNINITGVYYITQSFLLLLKKGTLKGVVTQDSLSYKYTLSFTDKGFTFITLSLGWVKTDLGSDNADIDVETSTGAVLDLITHVGREDNSKFFNIYIPAFTHHPEPFKYAGEEIPW